MTASVLWVSTSGRAGAAGSEADPYRSIQDAINHAGAGATIMVRAGVYTENLDITRGGSAEEPLRLVSSDGRGAAEIRPADQNQDTIEVSRADNVVIDGFAVRGPTSSSANAVHIHAHISGSIFDPATNVVVQNCNVTALAGDGIKISKAENISILNNTVTGSTGGEEAIDAVGVHHLVIAHNDVSNANAIGIGVKGGSYDVLIEGNRVNGAGNFGIGVGGHTEEAYFWPGFIGSQSYEIRDVRVVGNEVSNTTNQGIRVLAGQNVELAGNWIHNVAHRYELSVSATGTVHNPPWPSQNVSIHDNSFDRSDWLGLDSARDSTTVAGNLTNGAAPSGWHGAGVEVSNTVWGTPDNDWLTAGAANDLVYGNQGSDTINGGSGNNTIVGGQDSADGADVIQAGDGNDLILGNGGADTIAAGGGANTVVGGFGADTLGCGAGADLMWANESNDFISAGDGADTIFAGFGDDVVMANQGNDLVFGNEGNDSLFGGGGADHFVFAAGSGADQITGFSFADGDRLDLQAQAFTVGAAADGDVLLALSGGGTIELNGIAPGAFSSAFVA